MTTAAASHSLLVRRPTPLLPFVAGAAAVHVLGIAAILLLSWFKLTPDIDLDQKPIHASLVRLGKKRDEKLLPRKDEQPPPPEEVKAPPPPVPAPPQAAVPVPGPAPQPTRPQTGEKAADSKKALFGAFNKLGKAPKPEELEGAEDGDARGTSATGEGDRYIALITNQVQRHYDVSQTISEQQRMFLKAQVFVRVGRSGEVTDVKLAHPSGNDLFDAAVIAAVKKAQPLSPPPPELVEELRSKGIVLEFKP